MKSQGYSSACLTNLGRGDNTNCSMADTETGTGDVKCQELTNIAETDHPGIEEPIQEEVSI